MVDLFNQLQVSLKNNNSEQTRQFWVHYLFDNKIELMNLLNLMFEDYPISMRFSWVLGGICELNPKQIIPIIPFLYLKRTEISIINFDRSLAKMFYYCGIPIEIEGDVIDVLFKWLLDSNISVSTKTFCMMALYNQSIKFPELKKELRFAIEDQIEKNSISFRKKAIKILILLK